MTDIPLHGCRRCHRELPATEFYSNFRNASGLMSWCKACCRGYQRQYRERSIVVNVPPLQPSLSEPLYSGFYLMLRPGQVFSVQNLPSDLTRSEANRLERIIMAFADLDPNEITG